MVTKKDSSGVRRRAADDDDDDDDDDDENVEDYGDGTSIPQRKGIILEGLLEKQGLRSRLWMKRHASLAGDAMSYSHGFFGSKKTARILVDDMVRTMQLQNGEPVSGTSHDTVEFGIILKGGAFLRACLPSLHNEYQRSLLVECRLGSFTGCGFLVLYCILYCIV